MDYDFTIEVGYSIATGKAFAPFGDIQKEAEKLLDRPVWTHEFANNKLWIEIRQALEKRATEKYNNWVKENSN